MLAPAGPEASFFSTPACPGLLSPEQPFGSITLPLIHSGSLRLTPEQFAELCQANPDAVLELASPSDEGPRGLTALRQKMDAYQRNGARLGWLLIPAERAVEIWEPMADLPAPPQRIEAASRLDGDPQFPGLAVDLEEIWAG
jgi:Uma2 family endonuclease